MKVDDPRDTAQLYVNMGYERGAIERSLRADFPRIKDAELATLIDDALAHKASADRDDAAVAAEHHLDESSEEGRKP